MNFFFLEMPEPNTAQLQKMRRKFIKAEHLSSIIKNLNFMSVRKLPIRTVPTISVSRPELDKTGRRTLGCFDRSCLHPALS